MKQKVAFERKTHAKTEFEITRSIEVCRNLNGDVEIRITAETEGHDPVSLPCTLSADDAMRLASVLLCIEEGFDGLVERAANEVRTNSSTQR